MGSCALASKQWHPGIIRGESRAKCRWQVTVGHEIPSPWGRDARLRIGQGYGNSASNADGFVSVGIGLYMADGSGRRRISSGEVPDANNPSQGRRGVRPETTVTGTDSLRARFTGDVTGASLSPWVSCGCQFRPPGVACLIGPESWRC